MGDNARLFFNSNNGEDTLHGRISLSEEQLTYARERKDALLGHLKPELRSALGIDVRHWLQGSYKNHTLIAPVRKGEEFDIDVGVYLLCHADNEGLDAGDAKQLNRDILTEFATNSGTATIDESKARCERIRYPGSFHIDVPLYYIDEATDVCRLATNAEGWIDSDPKEFQDWFDRAVQHYSDLELGKLRRVIRYLKAWSCLKWPKQKDRPSSIALTVLVAQHFDNSDEDDDAYCGTVAAIADAFDTDQEVLSPINGDDLLGLDKTQTDDVRAKLNGLKSACDFIRESSDPVEQYAIWTGIFEHLFPPLKESQNQVASLQNLPAITRPPRIGVRHLDKSKRELSNSVTDRIRPFKGEHLYFRVDNRSDYGPTARVHWLVRNREKEASLVNDLGHTSIHSLDYEQYESCAYRGKHYMECMIIDNAQLHGFGWVEVSIQGFPRPLRNPPKKRHYTGRR
jgi:hypothetical protein